MINHGLWSDADAAPPPTAYSISQSKPKLLLPEFDILQMVASLANYRIGGGGSTKAERSGPRLNLASDKYSEKLPQKAALGLIAF